MRTFFKLLLASLLFLTAFTSYGGKCFNKLFDEEKDKLKVVLKAKVVKNNADKFGWVKEGEYCRMELSIEKVYKGKLKLQKVRTVSQVKAEYLSGPKCFKKGTSVIVGLHNIPVNNEEVIVDFTCGHLSNWFHFNKENEDYVIKSLKKLNTGKK